MSHAELVDAIVDAARWYGWRVAGFRPARTDHGWRTAVLGDGKGWPDLVLVGHDRVLFREVKVGRDRLSAEQRQWRDALRDVGADWAEWRDVDWPTGIVTELSRVRVSS